MLYKLLISCLFFCSAHAWLDEACTFLEQYKRDVTVMVIGSINQQQHDALQNSFVVADSTLVLWDTKQEQERDFLSQNNVLLMQKMCTQEQIQRFAECEHVDLIIIPDVSIFPFDAVVALRIFTVAASYVFIGGDYDLVMRLKDRCNNHSYTCHGYTDKCIWLSLHATKKTLRRHYWIVPTKKRLHDVYSSFTEKKIYSKTRKTTTQWKSGVNLLTFLMLGGVMPDLTTICEQIVQLSKTPHNDFSLWNIIISGNYLRAIDCNDLHWCLDQPICVTYSLQCLEGYANVKNDKRFNLFCSYRSKLEKIVRPLEKDYEQVVNLDNDESVNNGITFALNGGRCGDCLLNYIKAKWVAWKYGLTLYIEKFSHVQKFVLYQQEQHNFRRLKRRFTKIVKQLTSDYHLSRNTFNKTFFTSTYYFCAEDWGHVHDIHTWYGLYDNLEFRQLLRDLVTPIGGYKKMILPKDMLTVAIHVRKGCGPDPGVSSQGVVKEYKKRRRVVASDVGHPLKFPPDHFYIDSLRLLLDHVDDQSVFVQIFTDHKDSQKIIDYYKQQINDERVTFADAINNDFVADMFDMSLFDCLIRPDSSFSKISELVGYHTIVMCPLQSKWKKNTLYITEIRLKDKESILTYKKEENEEATFVNVTC